MKARAQRGEGEGEQRGMGDEDEPCRRRRGSWMAARLRCRGRASRSSGGRSLFVPTRSPTQGDARIDVGRRGKAKRGGTQRKIARRHADGNSERTSKRAVSVRSGSAMTQMQACAAATGRKKRKIARTLMGLVEPCGHLLVRADDGACPPGLCAYTRAAAAAAETEAAQRRQQMNAQTAGGGCIGGGGEGSASSACAAHFL